MGKLCVWSLFFTSYFNLIPNLLIVSIWFLTFPCCVNLFLVIIFWMEIVNVASSQNKKLVSVDVAINYFFFWPFATLSISIQKITALTKLTRHWKVKNQIDTTERLGNKLKYGVRDRDQIRNLPLNIFLGAMLPPPLFPNT